MYSPKFRTFEVIEKLVRDKVHSGSTSLKIARIALLSQQELQSLTGLTPDHDHPKFRLLIRTPSHLSIPGLSLHRK